MRSQPDKLSATFAALADPTRRAILARLSAGEASVQDLAKPFKMTLPAVSKHLKVLEKAKLIRRGRSAQWRPCYLEAAPMKEAAEWVEKYRRFWEDSFESLNEYLKKLQANEGKSEARSKKTKNGKKKKKSKGEESWQQQKQNNRKKHKR